MSSVAIELLELFVVQDQIDCGVDVPTDGEIRRENYIYYHCRTLNGFDFAHLTRRVMRSGSWIAEVPTVTGPLSAGDPFLLRYYMKHCHNSRPPFCFSEKVVSITFKIYKAI